MLREQGVLFENNLPVKEYICGDTPESIRNHMVILEDILSDSNDLLKFFRAPTTDFYMHLDVANIWMHQCVYVHGVLKRIYVMYSRQLAMLDIVRLSVTIEESNEMFKEYIRGLTIHGLVKILIQKINLLNQRRLEEVLRCSLELCDAIHMVNDFVAFVNVFSWFPTVSEKYLQFITDDADHLLSYARKLVALSIEQQ
ncbi:hypothetical protein TNCT_40671 [Trichonephila clavata]|uniref:Uncharacterized protein n=1 Tax=Trichonephila clavata TaxID=2740835 RepID=A0A8X6H6Y9_TRICU|nr:hypothetical protein TNCT_40671 [Trichonephila clavata]